MSDPRRILIAEDDADSAGGLAGLLRLRGHYVEVAGTAADAIVLCRRSHFDVLLCDIGLPDASGNELVNIVKHECPGIRAVALSGYGMKAEIDQALASGFDAHLLKPVTLD